MSYIWTFLILISFIISLITNNFTSLINSLFDVPYESLKLLISIGSFIIIYNGIFQISIDSKLIKSISFLFKPILKKLYKINNEDTLELLCANFTANLLGLGAASTPIAIKLVQKLDSKKEVYKLICMNVSSFTIFPFTILTLRSNFNGINNFKIWIFIILISFTTTFFSLFICNLWGNK